MQDPLGQGHREMQDAGIILARGGQAALVGHIPPVENALLWAGMLVIAMLQSVTAWQVSSSISLEVSRQLHNTLPSEVLSAYSIRSSTVCESLQPAPKGLRRGACNWMSTAMHKEYCMHVKTSRRRHCSAGNSQG